MTPFGQASPLDGAQEQFRLVRFQLYNWGTFSGVFDFRIPREGYLFVGPSGSGKSTILDAHTALLTPPKWVDFNVAAREAERHGKDRSLMTYIRGAWAQQTGSGGEYVRQYLRSGSTLSAIAETYCDEHDRRVVLAQVLWVRGSTTAPGDAKRLYLVFEREFDIRELKFFQKSDFDVRRFKRDLPDAQVYPEFSAYQERFRRLLGIENERALRLLHKTQSAKNLGDLNVFMRDFMLDAPATFEIADRLVTEFGELNAAHQAVVAARHQIETLRPARDEHLRMEEKDRERSALQALQGGVEHYREHRRHALITERIAELRVDLEGSRQRALSLAEVAEQEYAKLTDLQRKKAGMDVGVLERLQKDIEAAEKDKPDRIRKREQAAAACAAMGWDMPDDVTTFVQRVEAARQTVHGAHAIREKAEQRKDALKAELRSAEDDFKATVEEVRALERQRSNLPANLLSLRQRMAASLGISEEKLPFVGELLEVKSDAAAWQGAIERVLGGFARSILVEEKHYDAVSAYVNGRDMGERLVYHRVIPHAGGNRSQGPSSLSRKLNFAQGQYTEWLREELKAHFDLECAESLQAFRAATRAVTREGLIKHNATRHEKNDRQRIDDRSRWVLGFDNKDKLRLFKERAAQLGERIGELQRGLEKIKQEENSQHAQVLHCQTLSNLTWAEVDVGSLLTQIASLTKQLKAERAARPDLARMDDKIKAQEARHKAAADKHREEDIRGGGIQREIVNLEKDLAEIARRYPMATQIPTFKDELDARFTNTHKDVTLKTLDQVTSQVEREINNELRHLDGEISELRGSMTQRFAEFNRRWPAEAGGLDPTMESAEDYFGKLGRLEADDLPRFEERFHSLLREQSDQNLTLLSTKLDQERTDIKVRMELVNESLRGAPFNPGTHLIIETSDRQLEEVRNFRADLKNAFSHSFSAEPMLAEQRFVALAALVKRLASQETFDKNWRALVLDVRQHVEFVARELDADGIEQEVYRSGAGKSGGQRQKLAATCLAAALRYQLGGQDRALPSFSTVVLDEAFDKADAEFTAMAMNIFKTFGFQMIVATPLKSVMTLEPFIGGACFVHIKDRKTSTIIPIDYDTEAKRLKLAPHVRHAEEALAT